MCKKIATVFLGFSLLAAPVSLTANPLRVKNLYRIYAATGAIRWLIWAATITAEKKLFSVPIKKRYSLAFASVFTLISMYNLAEFVGLMRK